MWKKPTRVGVKIPLGVGGNALGGELLDEVA